MRKVKKENVEAQDAAYALLEETNKYNIIKKSFEERREELQNIIRKYLGDETSFNFEENRGRFKSNPTRLLVTNVVQKKITWDIPKLKKKLSKEILNKIIDKTYTINDFEGLVKYLKKCGVDPKVFKSFIDVEENVINDKVDLLSDTGELDFEDVSGCYSIKTNVGYIRITEQEMNQEN